MIFENKLIILNAIFFTCFVCFSAKNHIELEPINIQQCKNSTITTKKLESNFVNISIDDESFVFNITLSTINANIMIKRDTIIYIKPFNWVTKEKTLKLNGKINIHESLNLDRNLNVSFHLCSKLKTKNSSSGFRINIRGMSLDPRITVSVQYAYFYISKVQNLTFPFDNKFNTKIRGYILVTYDDYFHTVFENANTTEPKNKFTETSLHIRDFVYKYENFTRTFKIYVPEANLSSIETIFVKNINTSMLKSVIRKSFVSVSSVAVTSLSIVSLNTDLEESEPIITPTSKVSINNNILGSSWSLTSGEGPISTIYTSSSSKIESKEKKAEDKGSYKLTIVISLGCVFLLFAAIFPLVNSLFCREQSNEETDNELSSSFETYLENTFTSSSQSSDATKSEYSSESKSEDEIKKSESN